jgi:hypothetical protein
VIIPPATSRDTMNIAMFCNKSKLPAKKTKKSIIKDNQQMPVTTVPATLEPREFIVLDSAMKHLILLS